VIFEKIIFVVVGLYKMRVWLNLWFDFFFVQKHVMICLVKIIIGIDVVYKMIKNDIN
jgi:hypothetical protein